MVDRVRCCGYTARPVDDVRIILAGDGLLIRGDATLRHFLAAVPGRVWDRRASGWRLPLSRSTVELLQQRLPSTRIPDEALTALACREEALKRAQRVKDAPPVVSMPVRVQPYAHQEAAYAVALELLGAVGEPAA